MVDLKKLHDAFKSEFNNGNITFAGGVIYKALKLIPEETISKDLDLKIDSNIDFETLVDNIVSYLKEDLENVRLEKLELINRIHYVIRSTSQTIDIFIKDLSKYPEKTDLIINKEVTCVYYGDSEIKDGISETLEILVELGISKDSEKYKKIQGKFNLFPPIN